MKTGPAQGLKLTSDGAPDMRPKNFLSGFAVVASYMRSEVVVRQTPVAARDERAEALAALGPSRVKRLSAYANLCAVGLQDGGADLLQGAYLRWLESEKPVEGPDNTYRYLRGAIKSARSNALRHDGIVRATFGDRAEPDAEEEIDPVEEAPSGAASAEDAAFAEQLYQALAADPEVQMLVLQVSQGASRADIQQEMNWDDHKYEAVQKRKKRTVAKLVREGKI